MKTRVFWQLLGVTLILLLAVTLAGFLMKKPAATAMDPATDPSCVAYFDGCNNCTKMDGGAACTKKYCAPETMQQPKCLEYRK